MDARRSYATRLHAFVALIALPLAACLSPDQPASERSQRLVSSSLVADSPAAAEPAEIPDRAVIPGVIALAGLQIEGEITADLAEVTVSQTFSNGLSEPTDGRYVFPLPNDAAVYAMRMSIGDRTIEGKIKEREEAIHVYERARARGQQASLVTQERANVFTTSVANIEPGRTIRVEISYRTRLELIDGRYRFHHPTDVLPRFDRCGDDGTCVDGTGDGIDPPPRPPIDVDLRLRSSTSLGDVRTRGAPLEIEWQDERDVRLTTGGQARPLDEEIRVDYRLAGHEVEAGLLTHIEGDEGWFHLMVQPPQTLALEDVPPREFIFVVDTSGSMGRGGLDSGKRIMRQILDDLRPDDAFQVIEFDDRAEKFAPAPLPMTESNVARARSFVAELRADGGTRLSDAVAAALREESTAGRRRMVLFVTDGLIGGERRVLRFVHENLGEARIFTIGVGPNPNRALLDDMARIGGGASAYVANGESATEQVERFVAQVRRPAVVELAVDWGGLEVTDVFPQRLPDLLAGQPVVLTGRFAPSTLRDRAIRIAGTTADGPWSMSVPTTGSVTAGGAVSSLWARHKIASLRTAGRMGVADQVSDRILEVALEHSLLSDFTAFVAIDSADTEDDPIPNTDGDPEEETDEEDEQAEMRRSRSESGRAGASILAGDGLSAFGANTGSIAANGQYGFGRGGGGSAGRAGFGSVTLNGGSLATGRGAARARQQIRLAAPSPALAEPAEAEESAQRRSTREGVRGDRSNSEPSERSSSERSSDVDLTQLRASRASSAESLELAPRVLSLLERDIRRCADMHVRWQSSSSPVGAWDVTWVVGADGRTLRADLSADGESESVFERCVRRALHRTRLGQVTDAFASWPAGAPPEPIVIRGRITIRP